MAKLEAHYFGEVNETFERYVFNKRDKLQGESTDSYNIRCWVKDIGEDMQLSFMHTGSCS